MEQPASNIKSAKHEIMATISTNPQYFGPLVAVPGRDAARSPHIRPATFASPQAGILTHRGKAVGVILPSNPAEGDAAS
jgi:hypothetical protein